METRFIDIINHALSRKTKVENSFVDPLGVR